MEVTIITIRDINLLWVLKLALFSLVVATILGRLDYFLSSADWFPVFVKDEYVTGQI